VACIQVIVNIMHLQIKGQNIHSKARTHLEHIQLLKLSKYEVSHWQESIFCKITVLSLTNHFYKSFKMCIFKIRHTKSECFADKYLH